MSRHPLEPARLLLGLLLVGAGATCVMDATGQWRVPTGALLVMVPCALALGAFTSLMTFLARRVLKQRRERAAAPAPPAPKAPPLRDLPMDDLRDGYARSGRHEHGDHGKGR